MRVAVLSDAHSPRRWKQCPPVVVDALRGVDAILHAGDVCRAETVAMIHDSGPAAGRPGVVAEIAEKL